MFRLHRNRAAQPRRATAPRNRAAQPRRATAPTHLANSTTFTLQYQLF
jgi:hypothetical protein